MKEKKSLRLRKKIFKKQLKGFNKITICIDEFLILGNSIIPLIGSMFMFKILKKSLTKNLTNKK